ncbi:MAG TPA: site-specific integrase, partial [Thermoanaerobaculaceae bacterium]|nr:site-specific integrase [Thermoanaerobaculaceae bacterium]
LALDTGMRWGELARVQSSDVQGGWLVVHHTKSGKVRRIPLSDELKAELQGRVGKLVPFGEKSNGAFNRMAKRLAGFPFHAHQMRHTFACEWLARGGSLAALQAVMGHSSIVTTLRYARLSDEHVRAEAERIGGRSVADSVAPRFFSDSQECRNTAAAR